MYSSNNGEMIIRNGNQIIKMGPNGMQIIDGDKEIRMGSNGIEIHREGRNPEYINGNNQSQNRTYTYQHSNMDSQNNFFGNFSNIFGPGFPFNNSNQTGHRTYTDGNGNRTTVNITNANFNFQSNVTAPQAPAEHGLSKEQISHYPVALYKKSRKNAKDKQTTCSICLAEYESKEQIMTIPCFHNFHKDCIVSWLKRKSRCPVCQLQLEPYK